MILANFDFEDELAFGRSRRLSPRLADRLRILAGHLRILGGPAERILTPSDDLLEEIRLRPPSRLLAWGETERTRAARDLLTGRDDLPFATASSNPIARLLAMSSPPNAEIARRVNDRSFAFELSRENGLGLPAAELLNDPQSILAKIQGPPPNASRWIVKSAFSAAGRSRLWFPAGESPAAPGAIARLLRRGPVVVEPWLTRLTDFGICAITTDSGVEVLGIHRLIVNRVGTPQAIEFGEDRLRPRELEEASRELLFSTALLVGRRLAKHGYLGVFGIDSWLWIDHAGNRHLNPLGEINARLTFGLVALAHHYNGNRRLNLDSASQIAR